MEAGSLLEEALRHQREQHENQNSNQQSSGATPSLVAAAGAAGGNYNAVLLDVYLLDVAVGGNDSAPHKGRNYNTPEVLLQYANLAKKCNEFLHQAVSKPSTDVPFSWIIGGDGPVFGIHVTQGIPHLRAICTYGANVLDEWMAIRLMVQMTNRQDFEPASSLAISCWDLDDGQVMLIQMAEHVPDWFDQSSSDQHRHACWIHHGQIKLIKEPHATLPHAISALNDSAASSLNVPTKLNEGMRRWLHIVGQRASETHKTPLVVPRSLARLMDQRPDLINTMAGSFCSTMRLPVANDTEDSSTQGFFEKYQDWVWTTHPFTRTTYAMLRTMESPVWESENCIPIKPLSVEVKRYKRQCSMEATPHLNHALQMGVRLTVGLDRLLTRKSPATVSSSASATNVNSVEDKSDNRAVSGDEATSGSTERKADQCPSKKASMEQRVANWSVISKECSPSIVASSTIGGDLNWIMTAFQQGPNNASVNIEPILKCPVFFDEKDNLTLHSHPDTTLSQQLRSGMSERNTQSGNTSGDEQDDSMSEKYLMPRATEVDTDEAWMDIEQNLKDAAASGAFGSGMLKGSDMQNPKVTGDSGAMLDGENPNGLNAMLGKFQDFMVESSGFEGVGSQDGPAVTKQQKKSPIIEVVGEEEEEDKEQKSDGCNPSNSGGSSAQPGQLRGDATQSDNFSLNPRVMLNLVHTVLKGDEKDLLVLSSSSNNNNNTSAAKANAGDEYFYDEDFNLMVDDDDDDDGEQDDGEAPSSSLAGIMDAMDAELREETESRRYDIPTEGDVNNDNAAGIDPEVRAELAEKAHVLANMMESVDASGVHAGPVKTILQQMGDLADDDRAA